MSRVRWAAAVGLATGIAGLFLTLVPSISALEDTLGLRWLFFARGDIAPPSGVTIVSIDEAAAARMGLPPLVRDWPRATHAALVRRLVERGASTIAFDIEFFRNGPPADDEEFARAIRLSRRVILVQRFDVVRSPAGEMWQQRNPAPVLATGARGVAPVPLPDTPIVSWFWSFLDTPDAGEVPALPSVALQLHALPITRLLVDALAQPGVRAASPPREALDLAGPDQLLQMMRALRRELRQNPSAVSRAAAQLARQPGAIGLGQIPLVRALGELYTANSAGYLNFYGPPGTICTIPYDLASATGDEPLPCRVEGATVFVGVGHSRLARAAQTDTYHTIYESNDGVDLSGVEIHATAFANLLNRTVLRAAAPLWTLSILLVFGVALGASGYWARTRRRRTRGAVTARLQGALVVGAIAAGYAGLAYVLFLRAHVVVPLIVPLAVQVPAALILALLARPVVYEESVRAVCLAVDAGGSTALGQRLPHRDYSRLMRDYNRALAQPVLARGGHPLPPHGDGFVSVWWNQSHHDDGVADAALRYAACRAALEIGETADHFNRGQSDDRRLPVRMGLTVGTVTVHSDADRGVFDAIGDTLNVAARLQDLNRELKTQVLASDAMLQDVDGRLQIRPIGASFALKGVVHLPIVFEVVAVKPETEQNRRLRP